MKKLCLLCLLTGTTHGAVIYSETFGTWSAYTTPAGWTDNTTGFQQHQYNVDGYTGQNPNTGGGNAYVALGDGTIGTSSSAGTVVANTDYTLSLYLGGLRSGINGNNVNGTYTISLVDLVDNAVLASLVQDQSAITADTVQLYTLPTYSSLNARTGDSLIVTLGFVGRFGLADEINLSTAAVPEPSSLLLGALGVFGLVRRRR